MTQWILMYRQLLLVKIITWLNAPVDSDQGRKEVVDK